MPLSAVLKPFNRSAVTAHSVGFVSLLWCAGLVSLFAALFVVVRACGHDIGTVGGYLLYVGLYVALPGSIAMYLVNRGPVSLAHVFALALPTGFALEIFSFMGLAALGVKSVYPWMPLFWAALAVGIRATRGAWPVRARFSAHHAGICLGLILVFLVTVLTAASQMFSESPLAGGLPTRAIFHDWVYLVSRAAVIKHQWPLDDPSLAGTPLQYHYFMMVHAAAVSWTTKIEIGAVMLRLIYVPLGAVLVAQAYVLGRSVSRSPWGGVLAAFLLVAASETSLAASYGDPAFLGLFMRWLFVSPTFYFGMIFCGALLLAVAHCVRLTRCAPRHFVWLLLLGCAGTGAKGTLLPVVICAVGLWAIWRLLRDRRLPWRLIAVGVCLAGAFSLVYLPTMAQWKTGNAFFRPFHVFQLTGFWREYLPLCTGLAAGWFSPKFAELLASLGCASVVFAGTCGVRLLAIPFLFMGGRTPRERGLVGWLGAFFVASAGMGLLMELNSYGELYLILMMRLPMTVLTAAFLMTVARRTVVRWSADRAASRSLWPCGLLAVLRSVPVSLACITVVLALALQTSLAWKRNTVGFRDWLNTPTDLKPDGYMRDLEEALLWVRHHTEPDAVLVSNSCTPENMKKDHWGALDRTLTGVHFYYSALSERRLWLEGPAYLLDATNARIRANLASDFFYRGRQLAPQVVGHAPAYVVLDHSLRDGAVVPLSPGARVFSNARMDVYRLDVSPTFAVDPAQRSKRVPALRQVHGLVTD